MKIGFHHPKESADDFRASRPSGRPGRRMLLWLVTTSATAALALSSILISALGAALQRASAHYERTCSDAMIESMPGVLYFHMNWNRNQERASRYSSEEIT